MDCPAKMRFAGRLSDDSAHRGAAAPGTEELLDAVQASVTEDADPACRIGRMHVPNGPIVPGYHDHAAMQQAPGAPCTVQAKG